MFSYKTRTNLLFLFLCEQVCTLSSLNSISKYPERSWLASSFQTETGKCMRLLFLGKAKKCDYLISAVVKPGIIMMTFWPFINIITVQLLHSTVPLYVCYLNHPRISIWNGRKIFQGGSNSKITLELHLCWECNECECLESH